MSYHFSKTLTGSWDEVKIKVIQTLKEEGFGVLSNINIQEALKNKLGVDFRPYEILGACNPGFAHQALTAEPNIGTMLPCNVIMQDMGEGKIQVSAVDPVASMQAIQNENLEGIATEVQQKLKKFIEHL